MRKLLLSISGAISFVVFLILLLLSNHMAQGQDAQQMAERWSKKNDVAQISVFFSRNAYVTEESIEEFQSYIDVALAEASITPESENESARLWADAYSADGRIVIANDRAEIQADAIGVGGDFFLFHPLKLLYGAYFSESDLNQDYCIIDEDAAWQLFGSNNVVGMTVYIGGVPHIVSGVIERPEGRMEELAGLSGTVVYVSYQTLSQLGNNNGINHYEIVMPNPVAGFARDLVAGNIGTDENETEVIENTSRYSLSARLHILFAFGSRAMNGKAIIYPYWENIARGYEDIIALLTLLMFLLVLYPIVLLIIAFVLWWRHKDWTIKDVWKHIVLWLEQRKRYRKQEEEL